MSKKPTDTVTEIKGVIEPPASRDTGPTGVNGQGSAGAQIAHDDQRGHGSQMKALMSR